MIPENERARRGKVPLYKTNAHKVPRRSRSIEGGGTAAAHPLPKRGDALRVRTPVAARDLRKDHEKAAERKERREPERGVEAHKLAR